METKQAIMLLHDHSVNRLSYRTLAKKYGVCFSTARRMVMSKQNKPVKQKQAALSKDLPDDIQLLKEELRKEKLKNELLNLVIDISSKELGVDLRKKHGTRQSK